MTEIWFGETLHDDVRQSFRVERVIYRSQTDHQDLVIFENERLGRVLALDGVVQTTEGDEFIYHEMIAHVPILAHGAARRVCIIGGGDGGVLRCCLAHPAVERVVMVEIDRGVVDLCSEYIPSISAGAFTDPRQALVITDGRVFMAETAEKFDVIIVDSTDPIGPGEALFTEEFYRNCRSRLNDPGVIVIQSGVPFLQTAEFRTSFRRLTAAGFADVGFYFIPMPTYYGGNMALGWAATDPAPRQTGVDMLAARFNAAELDTRHYTPEVHRAAFAMPRWLGRVLDEERARA